MKTLGMLLLSIALAVSASALPDNSRRVLVVFGQYYGSGPNHFHYTLICGTSPNFVTCTRDVFSRVMFTDPDFSVRQAFAESSYGQVNLAGDVYPMAASMNGQPYEVDISTIGDDSGVRCNSYWLLGGLLDKKVNLEYDPSGLTDIASTYGRKVYVVPAQAGCDSSDGYVSGESGGNRSFIFNAADVTFEHEVGHTFGFGHTHDTADPMTPGGLAKTIRLFNAPAILTAGWMAADGVTNLTGDATYNLAPLELTRAQTAETQIYRLTTASGTYTLSWRFKSGVDRNLADGEAGTLRVNHLDSNRELVTAINPGSSFILDGVSIMANFISGDNRYLQFSVWGLGPAPPVTVRSVSCTPSPDPVGTNATCTVLASPYPTVSTTVALNIDNRSAASIPPNVTVQAWQNIASFAVTPYSNITVSTPTNISASCNGVTKTTHLDIVPGTPPPPPACQSSATTLCLLNRFKVSAAYTANGTAGTATPVSFSSNTALFWFFNSKNTELTLKVLDAGNQTFWVYYGGLTNLQYTITLTDTATGRTRIYSNPSGSTCGGREVPFGTAVPNGVAPAIAAGPTVVPGSCTPDSSTLCLTPESADGRPTDMFNVKVNWTTFTGTNPSGSGIGLGGLLPQTSQAGYFTFFNAANLELLVKVIDARPVNGRYWFYTGSLSDVDYTITFTDVVTGKTATVHNPNGNYCGAANIDIF